jgi:hypothetical protein
MLICCKSNGKNIILGYLCACATILIVTSILTSLVFAGECLEPQEDYLQKLVGVDPKSGTGVSPCIYSRVFDIMTSYTGLATPTAIQNLTKYNESTRDLAFQLLPPFLESPSEKVRCNTALALAFYGWPNSYDYVLPCELYADVERIATIFAILGDKRAVPWIINKYKEQYFKEPTVISDRKVENTFGQWVLINALYRFASPEILPFINEVIRTNSKNYDVKARAINVRKRIYELYPETKNTVKDK